MEKDRKKITIKDVAKHAGVGVGTVSRVLNGSAEASHAVKLQVEKSIAELGYKRSSVARSLRTQRTNAIAFFVTDISNVAFSTIAKGIHQVLEEQDYHLILYNTGNDKVKEKLIEAFEERKFDGMILSLPQEMDSGFAGQLKEERIPYFLLDREIQGVQANAVLSDYYNGIRQATEYLISLGHTKIGFMTSDSDIRPARESIRGYVDALKLNDLPVQPELMKRGDFTVEYGSAALKELIHDSGITAVIAGSNQLLVGCIETVRELKLDIPSELSVIGFEDSDFTRLLNPAITVVKRPLIQIGNQIAHLMLQRIKQEESGSSNLDAVSTIIPTELVIRDSCSPIS
ncbi:LacI family DNA-binding transcriptional regulator [Paenibacillus mendelii]|uniref:LacI family DNA-binding transcriptional regulator n=1 Tax=Paenibacillus mendelii TaxID=206163 RepID=A0ABV6JAX5_9BACL|nr:LacI family DNA-binding transcriptional regulator [Paenibacillus mendelii]MCQ6560687.1 LacI family transcriptional regulator [Paenibacillus mendelii]